MKKLIDKLIMKYQTLPLGFKLFIVLLAVMAVLALLFS